jgi:uncharacterized protein (UPF0248 family)
MDPALEDELAALRAIYGDEAVTPSPTNPRLLTLRLPGLRLTVTIPVGYPENHAPVHLLLSEPSNLFWEQQLGARAQAIADAGTPVLYDILELARELLSAPELAAANDPDPITSTLPAPTLAPPSVPVSGAAPPSKKAALRPSSDVIQRISWDESIPQHLITVGYEDRFLGIQERVFTAFNWADFASLSQTETAIPQHRIFYFKYRGEVVWDRRSRLDNIFGSTGGMRMQEVMVDVDARQGPAPPPPVSKLDEERPGGNQSSGLVRKQIPPQDRPNFFVSLRCDNITIQVGVWKRKKGGHFLLYFDN